jgi:uncharacterized protein YjbI with pentapeptide repeats
MTTSAFSSGQRETHDQILAAGVEAWNSWRDEEPSTRPLLGGTQLAGVNLGGVNFRRTELRGAILTATGPRGTDLRGADLRGANLIEADLRRPFPSSHVSSSLRRALRGHDAAGSKLSAASR